MGKQYQESVIEFRKSPSSESDYPESRGLVVYQYGGTIEECIDKVRHEFKLGDEWKVTETRTAKL